MGNFLLACLISTLAAPLFGGTVYWTKWTKRTTTSMSGVITLPDASTIEVEYSGAHLPGKSRLFSEFDYWSAGPDSTYESSTVHNRPPAFGLVAIGMNTDLHTITFSRPVINPIMPWMSVNGPGIQFQDPFTILSSGCGYFGCGTFIEAGSNLLRTQSGAEGHGTIMLPGTFSSISFNSEGPEMWRGFTVGVLAAVAPNPIPEPSTWALLVAGVAGLAARRIRR
jgi:hypothetical protein